MSNNPQQEIITIPTTKGYEALVDNEDADLSELKWQSAVDKSGNVYAIRTVWLSSKTRSTWRMHRVIMGRMMGIDLRSDQEVDHKDGNGLNNRRSNLRLVTDAQNARNRKQQSNNSSGIRGVIWHKMNASWVARIQVDGLSIWLGCFSNLAEAIAARHRAEQKYFGEFSSYASRGPK